MRTGPQHIDTAGAATGDALLYDAVADEYVPGAIPPDGVQSVTAGANITVDNTDPTNPIVSATRIVPLTTVINGVPDLVWEADNQMVFAEVPSA